MKKRLQGAKQHHSRNQRNDSANDPRLISANAFGGTLFRKARYRCSRPLSTQKPIHLVLRSSQATGSKSFHSSKNWKRIEKLCYEFAARYKIRIEQYINGGTHLHMVIRLKNKAHYTTFIRALTGAIALKVTGANRNQSNNSKFWDFRPFTTILKKGLTFPKLSKDYVTLNLLKDLEIIPKHSPLLRHRSANSS